MDGWLVGISPETLNLFFLSFFFFLFIRPLFCNRYEWLFGLFVFVFTAFSWWPAVFSFPSFSRCRPASRFPKSDYYQVSRECTLCCCLLLSFFYFYFYLCSRVLCLLQLPSVLPWKIALNLKISHVTRSESISASGFSFALCSCHMCNATPPPLCEFSARVFRARKAAALCMSFG